MLQFSCMILLLLSLNAQQIAAVVLTPEKVAELALQQGYQSQEIDLQFRSLKYQWVEAQSAFDWKLTAETNFENDRFQTFSPNTLVDAKYERQRTALGLERNFLTGTLLTVAMNRLQQKSDSVSPASQIQDVYGVLLKQSLVGNFFGQADRAEISSKKTSYDAASVQRLRELQDSVLDAVKLFWEAFVARENYRESQNTRDRYQKLADSVAKKSRVGFASPGELPQVQAELEGRLQRVQQASLDFVSKETQLSLLLKLGKTENLDLQAELRIPELPKLQELDLTELRAFREQSLRVEAQRSLESAVQAKSDVTLAWLLGAQFSGNDPSAGTASREALSASYPKYSTGLQLEWKFGSEVLKEELASKRALRMKEEIRFERLRASLLDQKNYLSLKLQSARNVALSHERTRALRQQVVQEVNKSYSQGRTELKNLIDALNAQSNAEVQWIRSVGDYQIALNEFAAFADQLVRYKELLQ